MEAQRVVKHFGGVPQTQKAFGLDSRQTVYYWLKRKQLPEVRARQAHDMTGGALHFDPKAYAKSKNRKKSRQQS